MLLPCVHQIHSPSLAGLSNISRTCLLLPYDVYFFHLMNGCSGFDLKPSFVTIKFRKSELPLLISLLPFPSFSINFYLNFFKYINLKVTKEGTFIHLPESQLAISPLFYWSVPEQLSKTAEQLAYSSFINISNKLFASHLHSDFSPGL